MHITLKTRPIFDVIGFNSRFPKQAQNYNALNAALTVLQDAKSYDRTRLQRAQQTVEQFLADYPNAPAATTAQEILRNYAPQATPAPEMDPTGVNRGAFTDEELQELLGEQIPTPQAVPELGAQDPYQGAQLVEEALTPNMSPEEEYTTPFDMEQARSQHQGFQSRLQQQLSAKQQELQTLQNEIGQLQNMMSGGAMRESPAMPGVAQSPGMTPQAPQAPQAPQTMAPNWWQQQTPQAPNQRTLLNPWNWGERYKNWIAGRQHEKAQNEAYRQELARRRQQMMNPQPGFPMAASKRPILTAAMGSASSMFLE